MKRRESYPETGLQVRLPHPVGGQITALAEPLAEIVHSLRELQRNCSFGPADTTWSISRLTHLGSEAIVQLHPRLPAAQPGRIDPLQSVGIWLDGLERLRRRPAIPPMFTADTVRRARKLARRRVAGFVAVCALRDGIPNSAMIMFDDLIGRNAEQATRTAEIVNGALVGVLSDPGETVPPLTLKVTLRNATDGQTVEGFAPLDLAANLQAGWRRTVRMTGTIRRNPAGQAIRIDAREAEVVAGRQARTADLANGGRIIRHQTVRFSP